MLAPFGLKTKGTVSARILPIATALAERGHQIQLVVPPWDDPSGSPTLATKRAFLEKINKVEILTLPLWPKPLVASLPWRMVQAAQSFRPDVIHVFKPKAYSGLSALTLSLLRQPFVLDTDDWEGAGGYNDVNPYSPLQKRLFSWQEQDLPKRAKAVTVASHTLQSLVWSRGVKREQVVYLPNGIARQKYMGWSGTQIEAVAQSKRASLGLNDKTVLLAYTRFAEFKPTRLLEIFQNVLTHLPPEQAAQVCLLVVGGGFFQEEKMFKRQAAEFGLADKIIVTGKVGWLELPGLLRCGDIAVYPFDDTLINRARCSAKLLELLVAERAVVTEAVGENQEYVKDGSGGRVVEPGNNVAFAEAVVELIAAGPLARATLGKNAGQRVWREYEWNCLVKPLEKLYMQL